MPGHFCCGAECGQISASGPHWVAALGVATIDTGTVRNGNRSLRFNASAAVVTVNTVAMTASGRWVGRCYVRFATLPGADTLILAATDTSGPGVRFKSSDSSLYAGVGTTFGSTGVSITTGQWYRVDFDLTINTGGSDTSNVQVNGTACGTATATGLSANATVIRFGLLSASTADMFLDDVILSNNSGDYPFGAGYVHHFVPTSDGSHNVAGASDFERSGTGTDILNSTTDAYQLIDDVPLESGAGTDWINMVAPPNASDYVQCVFGPAPGIPSATTTARALDFVIGYRQAGTGTGNMLVQWITPNFSPSGTSNDIYRAETVAGVTTIAYARKGDTNAPSDGAPGNTTQIRFTSPLVLDANPDQYLVSAMIEAEFAQLPDPIGKEFIYGHAVHRASRW